MRITTSNPSLVQFINLVIQASWSLIVYEAFTVITLKDNRIQVICSNLSGVPAYLNFIQVEAKKKYLRHKIKSRSTVSGNDQTERGDARIFDTEAGDQMKHSEIVRTKKAKNKKWILFFLLLTLSLGFNYIGDLITLVIAKTHKGQKVYDTTYINNMSPVVYDTDYMDLLPSRSQYDFNEFENKFFNQVPSDYDPSVGSYPFIPGAVMRQGVANGINFTCGVVDKWPRAIAEGGPTAHIWMIPVVPALLDIECHIEEDRTKYNLVRQGEPLQGIGDKQNTFKDVNGNVNVNGTNMTVGVLGPTQLNIIFIDYLSSESYLSTPYVDRQTTYNFMSGYFQQHGPLSMPIIVSQEAIQGYNPKPYYNDSEALGAVLNGINSGEDVIMTYTEISVNGTDLSCRNIITTRNGDAWSAYSRLCYRTRNYVIAINGAGSGGANAIDRIAITGLPGNSIINLDSIFVKPAFSTSLPEYLVAVARRYNFRYSNSILSWATILVNTGSIEYNITVGLAVIVIIVGIAALCEAIKLLMRWKNKKLDLGLTPGVYDFINSRYTKDDGQCTASMFDVVKPTFVGSNYDETTGLNHIGLRTKRNEERPRKEAMYK